MNEGFDRAAEYLAEVRHAFGEVAEEAGLSILECSYDGAHFGNAVVVLESKRLRVSIAKDRGQNLLSIGAPGDGPESSVDAVLKVIGEPDTTSDGRFMAQASLSELAEVVHRHRSRFESLFAPDHLEKTAAALQAVKTRQLKDRFGWSPEPWIG